MAIRVSFILAVIFANTAHSQVCEVCESGQVGAPDNVFMFPGQPIVTCAQLEFAGQNGLIPPESCPFLKAAIGSSCECEPTADEAADNEPAVAPTASAPVDTPRQVPIAVFSPVSIAPVAAPVNVSPVVAPSSATYDSSFPSSKPSGSVLPSSTPSSKPSGSSFPSSVPSLIPSALPSGSSLPSTTPSGNPSGSSFPSSSPSGSSIPSSAPSSLPSIGDLNQESTV